MDDTKKSKTVAEVLTEVSNATLELETMPTIIQLLIDNLKLDMRDWTEFDEADYINNRNTVYRVLDLVQRTIWSTTEALNNL